MKDKVFGVLQRVGRSFMLPIALLPVAGLLLGIGSSFTNPTTLNAYNLTNIIREGGLLYTILNIMSKAGGVVFDNLPLLFAMGVVKDTDYAFRNEKGEVDIATKKTLPITLMFDHRIGAFNDVMPFIKKLDEIFANPEIIREFTK